MRSEFRWLIWDLRVEIVDVEGVVWVQDGFRLDEVSGMDLRGSLRSLDGIFNDPCFFRFWVNSLILIFLPPRFESIFTVILFFGLVFC